MEDLKKQQAQLEGTFMTSFRSLWGAFGSLLLESLDWLHGSSETTRTSKTFATSTMRSKQQLTDYHRRHLEDQYG